MSTLGIALIASAGIMAIRRRPS
ncbi:MAG: hypothetical protein EOS43_33445 [Mesorhizobium sp.]|nr:MAG: hypothetical protein EOS43_33445 [Mesorhizobium sp.]